VGDAGDVGGEVRGATGTVPGCGRFGVVVGVGLMAR
jgi:hypothetical protein